MDPVYESIDRYIEAHRDDYIKISDEIWEFAETRFQEFRSARRMEDYLAGLGFRVASDLGGEKTAFIAEYGSGSPVIAILGEYDALEGMSQIADLPVKKALDEGKPGHGCGHNLLGTGALAAAAALKAVMEEEKLTGTIRFYGTPAEENAGGKAFLVRAGLFNDCDIALYWHPFGINQVVYGSSNANFRVFFTFRGTPSHAAAAPHMGRSALDAVELMDVGVNYMREHMIDEARIHYAITDSGGSAPNVVQGHAQVLYAIRAPKVTQVKELYERVCKIAGGAAQMTETEVKVQLVAAYSNMISNRVICGEMEKAFALYPPFELTEEEQVYAQQFCNTFSPDEKDRIREKAIHDFGPELAEEQLKGPFYTALAEESKKEDMKGSADLGDVSWIVPAAYFYGAAWAAGTSPHSWQAAAQGKGSIAHKAMLRSGKILAATGYAFLTNPELVRRAKGNLKTMLHGETYPNPLPDDCFPGTW